MKAHSFNKKLRIARDFKSDIPSVLADEKLLRIVFQNYISNAIKYTPIKGKITVKLEKKGRDVVFSVSNNGEPIPAGEQSSIFKKMFRASNAQKQDQDGNGLGLYLVKQVVENAGGKAWFTSKPGEDTVFYCSLPLTGMRPQNGSKPLT